MNYPGDLQPSLLDKYEARRKERDNKQMNEYANSHGINSQQVGTSQKRRLVGSQVINPKMLSDFFDREERMKQRMLNRKS